MTASVVLDRLLEPVGRSIPLPLARDLVALRADDELQSRIDHLADRCNQGSITPEERAEYEAYVQAIHFLGVLQSKARATLLA